MPDYSQLKTEEELAKLERRIAKSYAEASKDFRKIIDDFFEKFEKLDEEMRRAVESEKITEEQYIAWRKTRLARGDAYKQMAEQLAERVTKANEVAMAYVNDMTPSIYSLNRNYTAYTIEGNHPEIAIDFTIWNESTVRRLIVEEPDVMPYYPPEKAVNRGLDLAYGKQQIRRGVINGILKGDSVYDIADQLQERLTKMSRVSAIRAARTAVTAAQNGGRQDAYEEATDMGIQIKKRWYCTHDLKTRYEHGMLDGVTVPVNQPFEIDGQKLMYPADGSLGASPRMIYNCRCSMVTVEKDGIVAEPVMMREIDPETGRSRVVEYKPYKEWLKEKQRENPEGFATAVKKQKNTYNDQMQYARYKGVLRELAPKTLEEFQQIKYNNATDYETLKYQYRTINRYDVIGDVKAKTILELDNAAWYTKQKGFVAEEGANSKRRSSINQLKTAGNAAVLEMNGNTYFAHSSVQSRTDWAGKIYVGQYPLIGVPVTRRYETFAVESNGKTFTRQNDTEVKLLEYAATVLPKSSNATITMLTEKCMCESCQSVLKQFQADFPNVTVNIIQGRKDYNNVKGKEAGTLTWLYRKREK